LNPPHMQGAPTRDEIEAAAVSALMQGRLTCKVSSEAVGWALGLAWHQRRLNVVPTALWRELTDLSELDLDHEEPEFQRSVGAQLWLHARRELIASIRSMAAEWVGFGLQRCEALYPESWDSDLVAAWLGRMDALEPERGVCILEAVARHSVQSVWLAGARRLTAAADVQARRTVKMLLYLFGETEDRQRAASGLFSAKRRVSMEIIKELGETWERLSKRCPISLEPDELASLALRVTGDGYAEHALRERALEYLFAASGPGLDAALDRVQRGFPSSPGVQRRVHAAKQRLATSYWTPMELSQLFAFVRRRDLRIVRTQQDLFDVVGEALDAFQNELWEHADRLWNTDGKPKPEETLSKELEVFFRGYLGPQRVISVREPELCRVVRGMGPRVDVYVAVYPKQGRADVTPRLEVLLEVKRCVHQRWDQPESELKERYLSPGRRHGWYVVGRYDDGCAACNEMGLEDMQAHLDRKVALLAQSVVVRAKALDCRWAAAVNAKSRKEGQGGGRWREGTGAKAVTKSVSKEDGAQMSSTKRVRRTKGLRG